MKKMKYIIALAAMIMGATASAALIASESFSTGAATGDYTSGEQFDTTANKSVVVGNTDFDTGNAWTWGTGYLQPASSPSLTHSLVAGSTSAGAAYLRTVGSASSARSSFRRFQNVSYSGTTYYMSGLVNVGSLSSYSVGESVAMGAGQIPASTSSFIDDQGMFLGVTTDASGVHLAAFSGNNTYNLGDALTAQQASETQMIVLKMEYGAGAGGLDTLTAWTAQQGATELTLINNWDVEAGAAANLYRFMVGSVNGSDTTSSTTYLDEFRLGETLSDVTNIPEPATIGMLGLGGLFVILARRFRK